MLFDCSESVLKHFDKPKHVGTLDQNQPSVIHVRVGEHKIGEILDLYLDITAKQKIIDVKFQAFGNPFLIAGASFISDSIYYLNLMDAEQISYQTIMDKLQFPISKQATAVMLETALKQAIFLWRKKYDYTM